MKKRNPIAVFLLSIVTLGIYDIYWLVVTKKELNAKTNQHIPTMWLLFAPPLVLFLLFIVLAILGSGTNTGTNVVTLIVSVLGVFMILPISFYWFLKYSKAANEYTNGQSNTGLTFVLLWLLHFIGVAVLQDYYNDVLDKGGATISPTMPQPGPMPVEPVVQNTQQSSMVATPTAPSTMEPNEPSEPIDTAEPASMEPTETSEPTNSTEPASTEPTILNTPDQNPDQPEQEQ